MTLIVFLLSLQNNESCPAGYQQETVNFIYRTYNPYPNGTPVTCPIELNYCYFCGSIGFGFDIFIDNFTESCNFPINPDFWQQAETAMINDLLNKTTYIAPCDWQGWTQRTATLSYVACWKKIHQNGEPVYKTTFQSCAGQATCSYVYKVCVTYDGGVAHLTKIFDSAFWTPGLTCDLIGEPLSLPPNPTGYWETECFMFSEDCPNH